MHQQLRCLLLVIFSWGLLSACRHLPADPVPTHDSFTMQSKVLGEARVISVWQPADTAQQRLPVLYMPDGGVAEDFPHIANTVAELVASGAIPPIRVVGIENTDRQRDLTGPTTVAKDKAALPSHGGSAAFRAFIRDELFPEVERRYLCDSRRALVGESLAGLFTVETFMLEPGMFDAYVAVSPSLWWNDSALVRESGQHFQALPVGRSLFLTSASETDIAPHADALKESLDSVSAEMLRWTYKPRPDLEHHTIFRAMKAEGLKWALAGWASAAKPSAPSIE